MQTVPPDRMPGEYDLEGGAQYDAALDTLLANARRVVRIFEYGISRNYNSLQRCELLRQLLLAKRTNRVYIVLQDAAYVVRDCPRLITLLKQFSHSMSIHRTLPAAKRVYDPFSIADETRFVHRFHHEDRRGVMSVGDIAATHLLIKRFDEIWAASVPAISATTIGL